MLGFMQFSGQNHEKDGLMVGRMRLSLALLFTFRQRISSPPELSRCQETLVRPLPAYLT
jgi:hypothetical protein